MNTTNKSVFRKENYIYGSLWEGEIGKNGFGWYLYEKMIENQSKIFQINGITGESETYSSVLKRSIRVALELINKGVTDEDVVLLCSGNTLDAVIPIFATQLLNIKIACVDPSQSAKEIAYLLGLSKPTIGFVQKESVELITKALKESEVKCEIVVISDDNSFGKFLESKNGENSFKPKILEDYDRPTFIIFSSGTTGMPKGLLCSGYSMLNNAYQVKKLGVLTEIGAHLATFYWLSAMLVTMMVLINNGTKVMVPSQDVNVFIKALTDYKVSFAFTSYIVIIHLTEQANNKLDLSHLKYLTIGGSKVPSNYLIKCRKLYPNVKIIQAYGQTESSGYLTTFADDTYRLAVENPNSAGQPVPELIMKIIHPDTEKNLGINQLGEICYKSKAPFSGYYKGDSSEIFDAEGFIRTGDIGYFDKENCLFICDRIKDTFKYKSWHINPSAIEDFVYQHPAVKEAIVIGIPHVIDGAHPLAVVIRKYGFENTKEEEMTSFVNERVPERQQLRGGVIFLEEFPKTPSGKIIRKEIKNNIVDKFNQK